MYSADLRSRLGSLMRGGPDPVPPPGDRLAAVLVPLIDGPEPSLVLTRRTEDLSRHPGEISFPGGLQHHEDPDLAATALRETEEELGLPSSGIEILGPLEPVHTTVSAILIVPYVGLVAVPPVFVPNEAEIAEVLELPVGSLIAAEELVEWPIGDHVYRGYAYAMERGTIWGATARILHEFLDIVRGDSV